MLFARLAALAAATILLAGGGRAQTISPADAATAVAETQKLISRHYVFEEKKAPINARLAAGIQSGRYGTSDARDLARLVTEDLREAAKDGHLGLQWDPEQYKQLSAPSPAGADDSHHSRWEEDARRSNHGLEEMRILDGNVRYLRLSAFYWNDDETGAAYDAAMRFLNGGAAFIIDLRGNGGGSGSAVRYAISHFMPPTSERLLMTFADEQGLPYQSRVLAHLPAGRLTGKPLFVLTDRGTASAAEEFAYHVRQFELGTLVGETSAGAANNNAFYPVAPGFALSISVFSPRHGMTGGNWEGTGIRPHVEVSPATALEAAHVAALEKLAATAQGADRRRLDWALGAARAAAKGYAPDRQRLARYQGRFGDHLIRSEAGNLLYSRGTDAVRRLVPLGDGLFGVAGNKGLRIRFEPASGRPGNIELLYEDGASRKVDRTG